MIRRPPRSTLFPYHDALPIWIEAPVGRTVYVSGQVSLDADGNVVGEGDIKLQTETVLEHVKTVVEGAGGRMERSEEHTSELQSRQYLVCRLLLEKKKKHK